ncbi:MAG: response regulator transcription factor [Rhodoferax sp.]|nr:response regulator transcription factor [Rhodoferax sp.]
MFNLDEFSDTLLELTALAREQPVDSYQHAALSAVQRILPFDMAWWGIMSPNDGSFLLHSSHLFNLPAGYVEIWEQTKSDDNVAKAVREQPRRTTYFDERDLAAAPGLATLTSSHNIGQAFCTSDSTSAGNTFTFLSIYRAQKESRFTADELMLKQYLMPHLCSSWAINRAFEIEHFKASTAGGEAAIAVIDRQFDVVNAEDGFRRFIDAEWPDWQSASLPPQMLQWLHSKTASLKLDRIVMHRYSFADFHLLMARTRSRVDLLSKREVSIAQAFSRGLSYKEIARELDRAPATVRHHLRMIYEKLGVSDKATMTSALHENSDGMQRDALTARHRRLQGFRCV